MSDLLAARSQMAVSLAFHIIFAVIGIAMPVLMVLAERRWQRTRDPVYLDLRQALGPRHRHSVRRRARCPGRSSLSSSDWLWPRSWRSRVRSSVCRSPSRVSPSSRRRRPAPGAAAARRPARSSRAPRAGPGCGSRSGRAGCRPPPRRSSSSARPSVTAAAPAREAQRGREPPDAAADDQRLGKYV